MMYLQSDKQGQSVGLEDYLAAVRRHKLAVVVCALVAATVAVWYTTSRTDVYEASTAVAVGPTPVGATSSALLSPRVEREAEILASIKVAEEVIDRLSLSQTPSELLADVDVKFVPNSDVLQLSYQGTSPAEVSNVANGFVEVYTEQREAAAVEFYTTELGAIQKQLDAARAETERISELLEGAATRRAQAAAGLSNPNIDPTVSAIDAEIASLRVEQNSAATMARQVEQDRVAAERRLDSRQMTAEVIRLSQTPQNPTGISSTVIIAVALIIGAIIGVIVAFIADRLDRTASDQSKLSLALGSQVIGEIPSFNNLLSGRDPLVMLNEGASPRVHRAQEAFRRLRSAVAFLQAGSKRDGAYVMAISSAHPSEGKSTTCANLAVALAESGNRVVLVSGDLRRPTIERLFGLQTNEGLTDYLSGSSSDLALLDTNVDNLSIVPAGTPVRNTSEILGTDSFSSVVQALRGTADVVIIDTPPVLSAADALMIGSTVDGVVIVVDSRTTDTDDLLHVRSELERAGTPVIGGVLNRDRTRQSSFLKRDRYSYAVRPT